jgi:hypothetical protein
MNSTRRQRRVADYQIDGSEQRGGGCACDRALEGMSGGGYRPTRRNRNLLRRWRRGESIGFTATASLKAKGLIPRTSRKYRGKKILGPKYR